jgi:hypothetical protein
VPILVVLFVRCRRYYAMVARAVALGPISGGPSHESALVVPHTNAASKHVAAQRQAEPKAAVARRASSERGEREQSPDQIHHFAVVPVAAFDRSSMRALAYAASLGTPVVALHISPDEAEAKRFEQYWKAWGDHLPLQVVVSPYRAIVVPLARYIETLHRQRRDVTVTVVLPELIPRHDWQRVLHAGVASRLRRALRHEPRIVVATVPFHLPG